MNTARYITDVNLPDDVNSAIAEAHEIFMAKNGFSTTSVTFTRNSDGTVSAEAFILDDEDRSALTAMTKRTSNMKNVKEIPETALKI